MKKHKKGQQEELVTNKTQEEYNIFKTKDIKDIILKGDRYHENISSIF